MTGESVAFFKISEKITTVKLNSIFYQFQYISVFLLMHSEQKFYITRFPEN